ncbi:MAG: ABC transporter permease [Clostridia bacterium]|nr:ABC transporter permease [Clostridia bacterium]
MTAAKTADTKTTNYFSGPLVKQTLKSNLALTIVVLVLSCLICFVLSFAMSIMGGGEATAGMTDAQTFNLFMAAITSYNTANGTSLSWSDFMTLYTTGGDLSAYTAAFQNAISDPQTAMMVTQLGLDGGLSADNFAACITLLQGTDSTMATYMTNFQYYYVLATQQVFTDVSMSTAGAMQSMLEVMGMNADLITNMSNMDMSTMINTMYFHEIGILPMLIWIVVVGNSIIAGQVDRGSMAYVLSTPTKRSAVVITQAVYMVIVPLIMVIFMCCVKLICNAAFLGDPNAAVTVVLFAGMYLLLESMCGICYLGSCLFNRSSRAMAFGGGLVVLFFIAALIGMFGSDNLVSVGMGVEALNGFNYISVMTLFDIDSIGTIGSGAADLSFLWKMAILLVIAAATYVLGAIRFTKKDLPL